MQPIGILMKEHRLIDRMIRILQLDLQESKRSLKIDTEFIRIVVDFFTIYADKTHHGKEEDILFKALSKRSLSEELRRTMDLLIDDHKIARDAVKALAEANRQYNLGYHASIKEIHEHILHLVTLYPQHIETEDKHFFFPAMEYFTAEECEAMLQEFIAFDKNMIYEYYSNLVETQEKRYTKNILNSVLNSALHNN